MTSSMAVKFGKGKYRTDYCGCEMGITRPAVASVAHVPSLTCQLCIGGKVEDSGQSSLWRDRGLLPG